MRAALERELGEKFQHRFVPPPIPDHELLRRIGTGAYGDVWLARNALGTFRAVKIVYRERFDEERPYQREFNGILKYEPVSRSHEGLVQILHVGRNDESGCFYYVMELADPVGREPYWPAPNSGPTSGDDDHQLILSYSPRTLHADLGRYQRLPPVEAAQLGLPLAGALVHLHAHGLVHRDIKPSNVIFVGGKPKLADIGLITGVGDSRSFVGTEGFIPPEGPGTPQADLYGLGKLLYELAAGRDRMDFPQLPSDLDKLPEREAILELNEIITRACAPEPDKRYATATELVADLNLFLAGRSLRQARKVEQHLRLVRHIASAAAVVVVLAVGAVCYYKIEERRARQLEEASRERAQRESAMRQRAEAAEREQSRLRQEAQNARANETTLRERAETQELAARKKAYSSDMNLLQQALAADDLGRAQELLDRQRPKPGQIDLRGWEWRYFWQFCQSDAAFVLCQRPNSILSVSFSSDGTLVAVGTYGGEVTVWDLASRQMILRHASRNSRAVRLAFSPINSLLAFFDRADQTSSVVLWDSQTRSEVRRLPVGGDLRGLAFGQDGRLFTADLNSAGSFIVWDAANGKALQKIPGSVPNYDMGGVMSITPNGARLANAMAEDFRSVRVVDLQTDQSSTFTVADELTTALAFWRDGKVLLTGAGYADGAIKLWDVDQGKLTGLLEGHRSWVSCLKLLPDGKTLASASADRTVRLWDLETRQPIRTLHGRNGELWTIDASPDGRWLVGGSKDGSVVLWDLSSSANRAPAYKTLQLQGSGFWIFSPDSRSFGVINQNHFTLYDARSIQPLREPAFTFSNLRSFIFSPDMTLLVTVDDQGGLAAWNFRSRSLLTNFLAEPISANAISVVFRYGGKSLLTLSPDYTVREWDTNSWRELRRWQVDPNARGIAFSSGYDLMATGSGDGTFEIIPLQDIVKRRRFAGQDRVTRIALSPDGKTFADSSENGAVELFDTDTLQRKGLLHGVLLGYHSVTISPDGQRLAAGSNGQEAMKLWDLDSQEEVATLSGQGSFFSDAKFSPDGNVLSARNWMRLVHFWRAPSWQEIEAAEKSAVVGVEH
jgi:WD40 repeat protein